MLGILTDEQIDSLLKSELVGRLGCCVNNQPYIVPVAYAYDGDYIYGHTREGKKIDILRKNPLTCFQVDSFDDMANWRSTVINGEFEELKGNSKEHENALRLLTSRLMPFKNGESSLPKFGMEKLPNLIRPNINLVTYRIKILERSGKFEKE